MSRHQNLSNPNAEPARAEIDITCTVHFDWQGPFPKRKLQEWLESLPEEAKIRFTGISSGKPYFEASWKESR